MAKLKARAGVTGATWNGEHYRVNKAGIVNVPDEAVATLMHEVHGFTAAEVPKVEVQKEPEGVTGATGAADPEGASGATGASE